MEEILIEENVLSGRPSFQQVTAVVNFMEKHPDLANAKMRNDINRPKAKKLWSELTRVTNAIPGTNKTTQGWMRFWADKKFLIKTKKKHVDDGKHSNILTPLEERIWNLCFENGSTSNIKRKKSVKKELSDNDDDNTSEELPLKRKSLVEPFDFNEQPIPDVEEKQIALMEKLVQVMDRQSSALSLLAKSSLTNAQAMERIAEASQLQARAVDRLATSFESIGGALHDVRNAIINIDYTMKRCYPLNHT